jgi:hypothetical protein
MSKPNSYLTPAERRGWARGLASSVSRDEARSSFFAVRQGGIVHYSILNRYPWLYSF